MFLLAQPVRLSVNQKLLCWFPGVPKKMPAIHEIFALRSPMGHVRLADPRPKGHVRLMNAKTTPVFELEGACDGRAEQRRDAGQAHLRIASTPAEGLTAISALAYTRSVP